LSNTLLLRADGLKVRTASANKRYHVAVLYHDKLKVTKRTNDVKALLAEVGRLKRLREPVVYTFADGNLAETIRRTDA